jgi:pantoate--beta-alanine ligase
VIAVSDIAELRRILDEIRDAGGRIALVPTMGYLHAGHLALCDEARRHADFVVLSVFVNPLQFGGGEDLDQYPRDLARDARPPWTMASTCSSHQPSPRCTRMEVRPSG